MNADSLNESGRIARQGIVPVMLPALLAVLLVAGCASVEPTRTYAPQDDSGFLTVVDTLADDPSLDALVQPYRNDLQGEMSRVIGSTTVALQKDSPEGLLGNVAADAMLFAVRESGAKPADVAVTNNGGLRIPLAPGPITVGHVFELMPFENELVILSMPGRELLDLADDLAGAGGEPVAGLSLEISPDGADDVRVQGDPVDSLAVYRVVTSDYLANGGGRLPALWSDAARTIPGIKLRDAIISYIEHMNELSPSIEGRIR